MFSILSVIAEKLGIKLQLRDLRIADSKAQIKTIMSQWFPVHRTILEMVIKNVPPPNSIDEERAHRLLFPQNVDLNLYPRQSLILTEDFKECDDKSQNVIVHVSKMSPVHITQLPQNKPKRLTEEELQERRDEVRRRIEERKQMLAQNELVTITRDMKELTTSETKHERLEVIEENVEEFVFVAFARIFSGTLRKGMKLYNLAPKHDPRKKE